MKRLFICLSIVSLSSMISCSNESNSDAQSAAGRQAQKPADSSNSESANTSKERCVDHSLNLAEKGTRGECGKPAPADPAPLAPPVKSGSFTVNPQCANSDGDTCLIECCAPDGGPKSGKVPAGCKDFWLEKPTACKLGFPGTGR